MTAYTLREYIDKFYEGSQLAFAVAQGVKRQQVTQWLDKNFIVVDKKMYSKRRDLN